MVHLLEFSPLVSHRIKTGLNPIRAVLGALAVWGGIKLAGLSYSLELVLLVIVRMTTIKIHTAQCNVPYYNKHQALYIRITVADLHSQSHDNQNLDNIFCCDILPD